MFTFTYFILLMVSEVVIPPYSDVRSVKYRYEYVLANNYSYSNSEVCEI